MRVTSNMFPDSLVNQLGRLASRQVKLQEQVSSGQKIQLPEDDPSAVKRVMDLDAELKSIAGYRQNISTLQNRVSVIYDTIRSVKNISDRANEITVLADSLKSPEELKGYAAELSNLIDQAVQLGNSKYNDFYLFGGVKGTVEPINVVKDADGQIVSVSYNSSENVPEYQISQTATMAVDLPASNTSGSGQEGLFADSRSGADFLNHLISLRNHLASGDTDSVQNIDAVNLKKDEQHFIVQIADSGVKKSHLQTIDDFHSFKSQALKNNISDEADADLAQTITKLNQTQTAYLAALQTGASILNKSLLDYLH